MADALLSVMFNSHGWEVPGNFSNFSLDATNDGLAHTFQPNSTDPITHLGFRYGVRTGTPPTYIIGLESADASGLPNGTYLGGGTPASSTFTPPADSSWDGLWKWEAIDNAYTPSRGQVLALTIRYSSGTVDASNFSSYSRTVQGIRAVFGNLFPCNLTLIAGTWAKQSGQLFGYRTASGRYGMLFQSFYTTTTTTSGERSAMHFTVPTTWASTFKVLGADLVFRSPAATTTSKLGLWDSSGTMIQEVTIDSDIFRAAATANPSQVFFDESSLTALDAGTKYYIGVESVSSSEVGLRGYQLAEAADRSAFPNGTNRGLSTWDGATWTDSDTVLPMVAPILSEVTVPSGGSGGIIRAMPMSGGLV